MKLETAQKAAKWWAKFLDRPVMPDNGDKSEGGLMTSMLAVLVQQVQRDKLPENSSQSFERELTKILVDVKHDYFPLGVDYHPDYTLTTAMENAKIENGSALFPWKTTMIIQGDVIKVSQGYGSSFTELE